MEPWVLWGYEAKLCGDRTGRRVWGAGVLGLGLWVFGFAFFRHRVVGLRFGV